MGGSHDYKIGEDKVRQKGLESLGVHFLRISDHDDKADMLNVLRVLDAKIIEIEGQMNGQL
jgi:very-short-patch-repair endonuclease